jgi:hypothetical protein
MGLPETEQTRRTQTTNERVVMHDVDFAVNALKSDREGE